ncbi:MAG: transcription elongation factor Spt5 [Candidatus Thermoplasmatota archaeon]|nr:transcription elongation factor Spt5 [Candidatus Thermoplasmatota archaeon]
MIFSVKTRVGREIDVADSIKKRADESKESNIYAVLAPVGIKGYIFVEGKDRNSITSVIRGLRYVTGLITTPIPIEELESSIKPPSPAKDIVEGAIVEMTTAPFKGENARVISINEPKGEVTVELLDVMVPIPLTLKITSVKLVEKKV